MTKQEEIKEGILGIIDEDIRRPMTAIKFIESLLSCLDSRGAVIKGGNLSPNPYRDVDFHLAVAFDEGKYSAFNSLEPLIGDGK